MNSSNPISLNRQRDIINISFFRTTNVFYEEPTPGRFIPENLTPIKPPDELLTSDLTSWEMVPEEFYEDEQFFNMQNIQSLDYIKFRFKGLEIRRGRIQRTDGTYIPEASLPSYQPAPILFTLNNKYETNSIGSNIVTIENNNNLLSFPEIENTTANWIDSYNTPSQWYFLEEADTDFIWLRNISILNILNPDVTRLTAFLQQRIQIIGYNLEFEYKIPPINPTVSIETQPITMENLYKMLETFLRKRPTTDTIKTRDGISNKLVKDIKKQKQELPPIPGAPLSDEELEFFIEKIIGFFRK